MELDFKPIFREEGKKLLGKIAAVFPSTAAALAAATRSVPVKIKRWGYVITLSSKVPGGPTKQSGGRPLAAVWNWNWFGTKKRFKKGGQVRIKRGKNAGKMRKRRGKTTGTGPAAGRRVDVEAPRVTGRIQTEAVRQLQRMDRRTERKGTS
jgi:hypothetical protein